MMTAKQVSSKSGLSLSKVYTLARTGDLPSFRFGGAVLGHRSSASTRRYAHLATDNLKAAIGRIGRKAA